MIRAGFIEPKLCLAAAIAFAPVLLGAQSLVSRTPAENQSKTRGDLVANLHSDFAMFRGDLSREQGVNLIGASIVSDEYPGGEIGGRLAFWWFGWPSDARRTVLSRALAQIDYIDHIAAARADVTLIRNKDDLERVKSQHSVGLLLWMEGADSVADDPSRVRVFYDRGVRAIMLTHLYDNALGGSGSPSVPLTDLYLGSERGLTDQGRAVLSEMAKHTMVVDLAHASRRTFDDVLATWSGPVIVSHTAMDAVYSSRRNLTDEQARAIAERDGIVGIMAQTQFLGGSRLSNLADHIVHAAKVAGAEHVALGLDIEDAVNTMPKDFRDARDLPELAFLLRQRGLSDGEVRAILGDNAFRFWSTVLKPSRVTSNSTELPRATPVTR
jgi:membrane dipeptidase